MSPNVQRIRLRNGLEIPAVGFGTASLRGEDGVKSIAQAIRTGFRLLDTAYNYENEATVGQAVRKSEVPRNELLITSKLPGRYHAYNEALTAIEESLYRAGLDYFDFYLIHWPNPRVDKYVEAWTALLEAQKRGLIRNPGVCNFLPEHLEKLEESTGSLPVLNQIETHPYFNQKALRNYNQKRGIQTQAWTPLGKGTDLLENPLLTELADEYARTVSQIVLRWHIQIGSQPIPKASSIEHQRVNLDIFDFELSEEAITAINSLSKGDGRVSDQDPAIHEEF